MKWFHLPFMRKTRKWSWGPSHRPPCWLLGPRQGALERRVLAAVEAAVVHRFWVAQTAGRPGERMNALRSTWQRAQFDMLVDNESRVLLIFLVLLLGNEGGSPLRTGDAGGGGGGGAHHLERIIQVRTQQRMFDL